MGVGQRWLLGLLFTLTIAHPSRAAADVVILKDGARLEGDAEIAGNVVVVTFDGGQISVDKDDVQSMVPAPSRLHELEAREAKLGPRDVEGRIRVASWADSKGLASNARRLYLEVIAIDENHAVARRRLGFRRTATGWKKPAPERRPLPARPRSKDAPAPSPELPLTTIPQQREAEALPPLTREEWDQISWHCIMQSTFLGGFRGGGFGSHLYQACMVEELGSDVITPPDEEERPDGATPPGVER